MRHTDRIESIIRNFFARKRAVVKTTTELDKRIIDEALLEQEKSKKTQSAAPQPNIWRIIMKSRITQLTTTAAAVLLIVFVLSRGPGNNIAWGDIVNAVNETNNVHILMKMSLANGQTRKYEAWLKNKVMLREETEDRLQIDNGVDRLVVEHEKKTFQFMDSYAPFEDFQEEGMFELLLLFRGQETPYKAEQLIDECTDKELVYRVSHRGKPYGKVWVERRRNLPLKIISEEFSERVSKWEAVFDYDLIPEERFRLDVPAGYTVLPQKQSPTITGRVVDEQGNGLAGALVYTPSWRAHSLWAQTDETGHFILKYPAFVGRLPELPMFIRAIIPDEPYSVAWTIIRNPEPGQRDGNSESSNGENVWLLTNDVQKPIQEIPGEPGTVVLRTLRDVEVPFAVEEVVLKMEPAAVIAGRVTDDAGEPIHGVKIVLEVMTCLWKGTYNRMDIQGMGDPSGQRQPTIVTDSQGRYVMGHLPNLWGDSYRFNEERSYFLLEAEADGYAIEDIRISSTDDADFTLVGYDIVIRGTVIDNQGQPLSYREVDIEVDDDQEEDVEDRNFNVEQAVIDEQGRFELYVPRVKGLMLTLELNNPYMWRNKLSDRGIEKDERDPAFVYYLDMEVPIRFEPDKNEYWVEIVPQRPDITITVEVTDADGIPLPGIPVVPYTRRREIPTEWSLFRLIGITDQNGMCIITGVPRVEKLLLEFCQIPEPFIPFGYNDRPLEYFKKFLSEEYITALSKSQQDFVPASQEVTLEEGKRDHTVRIVLSSKP